MRILVLASWYPNPVRPIRGSFFVEQAEALAEEGHAVSVVAVDLLDPRSVLCLPFLGIVGRFRTRRDNGVVSRSVVLPRIPRMPRLSAAIATLAARWLYKQTRRESGNPDIIHAHGVYFAGIIGARLLRDAGCPLVITEHSTAYARGAIRGRIRALGRKAVDAASEVIAVSTPLRDELIRCFRLSEVEVIPNMVNTQMFQPAPSGRKNNHTRFVTVAALKRHKGVQDLLHAFARLVSVGYSVSLTIAGDGPERVRLDNLASRLGVGRHVRFLGELSRHDVATVISAADCFVLPSHVETFGVVAGEALSCGVPVIATRCGGPEDFITPDVGRLIEPGDVDGLVAAMTEFCDEHGYDESARTRIRRLAVERFSPARIAQSLTIIYGHVCQADRK
jgi:glycosyltransferase involved in cell wall biosynthesis